MCLTGNKNWWQRNFPIFNKVKPKIASKDIVVYKVLEKYNLTSDKWYSPFMGTPYILGQSNYAEIFIYQKYDRKKFTVEEGIHAYTNLNQAIMKSGYGHYKRYGVFKCIIPKGSKYLIGNYEEIVTNHLIVLEKV